MLSRAHRLRGDRAIQQVVRKRERPLFSAFLSVRFVERSEDPKGPVRCAFVVSTKVDKRAVVRNRLRRRLREIVRPLLPTLPKGTDILIAAKPIATTATFAELRADCETVLAKVAHRK